MNAIDLLLSRQSCPRLTLPAPSGQALDDIFQAAIRVPDHAALTPWKFIACEGEGLVKLGKLFEKTAIAENFSENDIARASKLPERAPMVIICIMQHKEHQKVPRIEQVASTACAVQSMQMMALAHSFSGIWRTGSYAHSAYFKNLLGLNEQDEVVGFLYLGTPEVEPIHKPAKSAKDYFEIWC